MDEDTKKEGTISVGVTIPAGYWLAEAAVCRLQTWGVKGTGIYAEASIREDHTLDVQIDGPLGRFWELRSKPIVGKPEKMMFHVTWKDREVNLYVGGELHQTQTLPMTT